MRLVLVLAGLAVGALAVVPRAQACGNSMQHERLQPPNALMVAEKAFRSKQFDSAFQLATQQLARADLEKPLVPRANELAGLSALRLGRHLDAVMYLEVALRANPGGLFLQSKLGEAEVYAGKAAGQERLEKLAASDWIADAGGWAALAKVRYASGSRTKALEAYKRAMAMDPSNAQARALQKLFLNESAKPSSKRPSTT